MRFISTYIARCSKPDIAVDFMKNKPPVINENSAATGHGSI
jgi:hypothetical protein